MFFKDCNNCTAQAKYSSVQKCINMTQKQLQEELRAHGKSHPKTRKNLLTKTLFGIAERKEEFFIYFLKFARIN